MTDPTYRVTSVNERGFLFAGREGEPRSAAVFVHRSALPDNDSDLKNWQVGDPIAIEGVDRTDRGPRALAAHRLS